MEPRFSGVPDFGKLRHCNHSKVTFILYSHAVPDTSRCVFRAPAIGKSTLFHADHVHVSKITLIVVSRCYGKLLFLLMNVFLPPLAADFRACNQSRMSPFCLSLIARDSSKLTQGCFCDC